jgi:hypothetical protein
MITTMSDFYRRLEIEEVFEDETFNFLDQAIKITTLSNSITFENCTFICNSLEFCNIKNPILGLLFTNCTFYCKVDFSECSFDKLAFLDTKKINSLHINGKSEKDPFQLNTFDFQNSVPFKESPALNTDFCFQNITIIDTFSFININHINGRFCFSSNKIGLEDNKFRYLSFIDSSIFNPCFTENKFKIFSSFNNIIFKYLNNHEYNYTYFHENQFNKVSFSESNFIGNCAFEKCDFLSTTWFEECKNLTNSKLRFVACEFKGFSLFNKSKINFLVIDRCTFDKSSSFTDAEFNTLKLFEVKFGGGAYFDEMKINKVLDKSYLKAKNEKILEWKRTLRAIKQELQKTENKIDFNRFRSYELAAHYKELSLWRNFKDTSILWSTKWTTDFGLSWTRAFWFTILSGLFWYSILYRIENSGVFNSEKVNEFFVGAFRFFLVTDFYNPLETDRVYLTNPLSWFVFILGKIVIAFGIYEMIQSFRKFKA